MDEWCEGGKDASWIKGLSIWIGAQRRQSKSGGSLRGEAVFRSRLFGGGGATRNVRALIKGGDGTHNAPPHGPERSGTAFLSCPIIAAFAACAGLFTHETLHSASLESCMSRSQTRLWSVFSVHLPRHCPEKEARLATHLEVLRWCPRWDMLMLNSTRHWGAAGEERMLDAGLSVVPNVLTGSHHKSYRRNSSEQHCVAFWTQSMICL